MNHFKPVFLGAVLLLIFAAVATAQSDPCKECFWGLCQNTPTGVPGKDSCSNAPKVEINCTVGVPGGLVCGVTFTPQCVSSGPACMNWMEFIWVSGGMESPKCDDRARGVTIPPLRPSPIFFPTRITA